MAQRLKVPTKRNILGHPGVENAVNFGLNNVGSLGSEFVENDGDVDKDGNVVFVDDSS